MSVSNSPAWKALQAYAEAEGKSLKLSELFVQPERTKQFSVELEGFYLDYSKNRVNDQVMHLLFCLADERDLKGWIKKLLIGSPEVNDTEDRPALHTALRDNNAAPFAGKEIHAQVREQFTKMSHIVNKIRSGHWRGVSGKPITDVVNIGVGGSDLGPLMVTHALQTTESPVQLHFISSIDGTQTSNLLKHLNQETTLFILASKSFSTIDTLSNAETAKDWLRESGISDQTILAQHFLGVSTKPEKMTEWGIPAENQLMFWDWVGGRYSLWSTIGLPIALQLGMDGFEALLEGAHEMDRHFHDAPLDQNMPVLMGLIDVWNVNFLDITDKAILPYDARLKYLPSYFEQLVMESNGKSVNRSGERVDYSTCPILWGEVGPNAQHAFYQLLHQGTQRVMCDFIAPVERDDFDLSSQSEKDESLRMQHALAMANCFAQSRVLMLGDDAIPETLKPQFDSPFKHYPGNQPSNTILMQNISARTIGMLVALYEHKTFVESVMWDINPFDQWGVELGKLIAKETHSAFYNVELAKEFDESTQSLIQRLKK